MPFLRNTEEYFDDNATMLIHMDLNPLNLKVKPEKQEYRFALLVQNNAA
jgi:hypothetical protein